MRTPFHLARLPRLIAALALVALQPAGAQAQEITRTANPASANPIARAVNLPPRAKLAYISGTTADISNPDAPKGSVEAFGDTRTQALSVLRKIEKLLTDEGLAMADVVKVNVYLVGDPRLDGKMDFAGLNAAYGQFFGTTAQPNKPVRTALQIAALPKAGGLVEIEVTAARAALPTAPIKTL